MLKEDRRIRVRVSNFSPKLDSEAKKWYKVTLGLILDEAGMSAISTPFLKVLQLMKLDASTETVSRDDEMKSMRIELYAIEGAKAKKIIECADVFEFEFSREKNTKAGTLKKERSGQIVLQFRFTCRMSEVSGWIEEVYGNLIDVELTKAQGQLATEPAEDEGPDSQAARNKRILAEETKDKETDKKAKVKK